MNGKQVVAELYQTVWSRGCLDAIHTLVAPEYTIHRDPGDAWEGQTLNRDEYRERVMYSRTAFGDLAFEVHELLADGNRVVARWSASGKHTGDLNGIPATGRQLRFAGMTLYALQSGQVSGHWQEIDRLGFIQQVGVVAP